MIRKLSVLTVLLVAPLGAADAQSPLAAPRSLSAASPMVPAGSAELLSAPARATLQSQGGFAGPRSLAFGLVGGLIGAGTGFLVSQVVHSDWEKSTNSEFASHRRSFALSGAAVGTVVAFLVARSPAPGAVVYDRSGGEAREGSGGAIGPQELENSSARNAYEAVSSLRPQWLVVRGATLGSFGTTVITGGENGGTPKVTSVPGSGRIGAFLDSMPLESLEALRDVPIVTVARIEFRTASVGSAGPGHVQRAIVVITASGLEQ